MPKKQAAFVVFLCFFLFSKKEMADFAGPAINQAQEISLAKTQAAFAVFLCFFLFLIKRKKAA